MKSIIGGHCVGSMLDDEIADVPFRLFGNGSLPGTSASSSTEERHPEALNYVAGFAGTIRNIAATCRFNARDVPTYIVVQINGVDSVCVCTIPAVVPGTTEVPGVVFSEGEAEFVEGDVIRGIIRSASVYSNDDDNDSILDRDEVPVVPEDNEINFGAILAELDAPAYVILSNGGANQKFWHYTTTDDPETEQKNVYVGGGVGGEFTAWYAIDNVGVTLEFRSEENVLPHIQGKIRSPGTAKNLRAYVEGVASVVQVIAQPSDGTVNGHFTKNGSDTGMVITTPPDLVGETLFALALEDTENEATVADGDLVNFCWRWPHELDTSNDFEGIPDDPINPPIVGGDNSGAVDSSAEFAARGMSVEIHSGGETADLFVHEWGSGWGEGNYEAGYDFIGGGLVDTGQVDEDGEPIYEFVYPRPSERYNFLSPFTQLGPTTEIECTAGLPTCTRFSNTRFYCGAYNGDAPLVIRSFIDGVQGNQVVTIDGVGWFEDTENTDDVGQGSSFYYRSEVADSATSCFARIDTLGITTTETECPEGCTYLRGCEGSLYLEDLKERTQRMVAEDPAEPLYWTDAEMRRYVNDAYTEICRETKALESIEGVALTADSEAAALSPRVVQIFRATFDDRKIENITKAELDRCEIDWESQAGYVSNYVTTQQDQRTISTFKAWDGSTYNAEGNFLPDGYYTYETWTLTTDYAIGDRVTVTSDAAPFLGRTFGYEAILQHTSGTTSAPGIGATWETYWVPIALQVWHVKNPHVLDLTACNDEPELPPWAHLAIAYRAAARALKRHGEQMNGDLAKAYEAISLDYADLLRALVANRTPERIVAMGSTWARPHVRNPKPYDQIIEEP